MENGNTEELDVKTLLTIEGKEEDNIEIGQVKLERNVSTISGIGLIVGSIIGSGIFLSPSSVLKHSGSLGLSLVIWVLSGIISMLGALCYGELGAAIQKSGGEHAYFHESIGPISAFLFSWTAALVIRPSAGAIIAMIFAQYIAEPFYEHGEDVPVYLIKLLAFACLVIITVVNCISVKLAVYVQNIFTFSKLVCIGILVVIGAIELGKGNTSHFKNSFNGSSEDAGEISLAFYSGLWAYDGWNSLNYVTEEMPNPGKQLPIAIGVSMLVVIVCYLFCNIAYIAVMGARGITTSAAVALDLGNRYLGPANFVIPVLVGLSCFGAVNGLLFSSGRLVYAAARESHMPRFLAMLHVRRKTPLPSLVFTSLISCLMLIPNASKFESLVGIFSVASWIFYGLSFAVLLYLRYHKPNLHRPYKVFIGIPVLMLVLAVALTILPIIESPVGSFIAIGLILAGIPVYFVCVRFKLLQRIACCRTDLVKKLEKYGLAFPESEEGPRKFGNAKSDVIGG